ncbi:hypothetical protein DFJ73DRAFT_840836 [Zopfochytrium polystomum]|nr:hypothetical protein DFJ73DRAFT_840836 [Zopfochytrium polystomum]
MAAVGEAAAPTAPSKAQIATLVLDVLWNSAFVALNAGFLGAYYPPLPPTDGAVLDEVRVCDSGVLVYLVGQLGLYALYSLPQKPLQFYVEHVRPDLKRHPAVVTIWNFWSIITLFDLCWFVAGQVSVFRSTYCRAHDPPLYWLAVSEIIIFYVTIILPIFFYIIALLIARRYQQRAQLAMANGPAAHLRGGLSKSELASLRTFLFKPSLSVSPEAPKEVDEIITDGEDGQLHSTEQVPEEIRLREIVSVHPDLPTSEQKLSVPTTQSTPVTDDPDPESKLDAAGTTVVPNVHVTIDSSSPHTPLGISDQTDTSAASGSTDGQNASSTQKHKQPLTTVDGSGESTDMNSPLTSKTPPTAEPEEPLPEGASTTCAICFCEFEEGDRVRELACHHIFHAACVDPWLATPEIVAETTMGLSPSAASSSSSSSSADSNTSPISTGVSETHQAPRESPTSQSDPTPVAVSSSSDYTAHRTCPLCVREAILPEFRDPEVELAMAAARADEEALRIVMERSRIEAERRAGRRSRRAAANRRSGGGSVGTRIFTRGRSRGAAPAAGDGEVGAAVAAGTIEGSLAVPASTESRPGWFSRSLSPRNRIGAGRRRSEAPSASQESPNTLSAENGTASGQASE